MKTFNLLAYYIIRRKSTRAEIRVSVAITTLAVALAVTGLVLALRSPIPNVHSLSLAFSSSIAMGVFLLAGMLHLLFVRPDLIPVPVEISDEPRIAGSFNVFS